MRALVVLLLAVSTALAIEGYSLSFPTWRIKILDKNGRSFKYQQFYYNPCRIACPKVRQCVVIMACHAGHCAAVPLCHYHLCEQPVKSGSCTGRYLRYYFDKSSGFCRGFIYTGCWGNENRFDDLVSCNRVCGRSLLYSPRCYLPLKRDSYQASRSWTYRFSFTHDSCQRIWKMVRSNTNYFPDFKSCTETCRKPRPTSHPCFQPLSAGYCSQRIERYHFNMETGKCEKFSYSGCGGNENNFRSLYQCSTMCRHFKEEVHKCFLPKKRGHCHYRQTRYYFDTHTKQCTPFRFYGCDKNENHFYSLSICSKACHRFQTQVDVCSEPMIKGPCTLKMKRFWYNRQTNACEEFVYGGCRGNSNNFEDLASCSWRCVRRAPQQCYRPAIKRVRCKKKFWRYRFNRATNSCERKYVCVEEGNNFSNFLLCNRNCVFPRTEVCHQPKVSGPCKSVFWRYWYNRWTNKCEPLLYGGCKKNANNFRRYDSCRQACVKSVINRCFLPTAGVTCRKKVIGYSYNARLGMCLRFRGCKESLFPDHTTCTQDCIQPRVHICQQPQEAGPCKRKFWRYWYNSKTNKCDAFTFGGCGGNANNFKDLASCTRVCSLDNSIACLQQKVVGPCKSKLLRYWYNVKTNRCEQFFYGGCQGNANNFNSLYSCQRVCYKRPVDRCSLPRIFGTCQRRFYRFYYNKATRSCQQYFGCPGVGNNFPNMHACIRECVAPKARRCNLSAKVGSCLRRITRFSYNKTTKRCEMHIGCPGNPGEGNDFPSLYDCNTVCVVKTNAKRG